MTNTAHIRFIRSGIHTTLQDEGRFGFQNLGIGPSGAADKYAYRWANKLLGNPPNTAAIESFYGNLELQFSTACTIAITGAEAMLKINDEEKALWSTINIDAGDTLTLGPTTSGLINYLALAGDILSASILDSLSINTRERIGPNAGKPFSKNSLIEFHPKKTQTKNLAAHWDAIPDYKTSLTLRFIPSSLFLSLEKSIQEQFLRSEFKIGKDSNKIGKRLEGPSLTLSTMPKYSEAVCEGTIQIPNNGQPIVLLSDRQTIGGYPKIGTVYKGDCWRFNQAPAENKILFEIGNAENAQRELKKYDI